MQKEIIFVFLFITVCNVFAYLILEREDGEQYYLIPVKHQRVRRQINLGISRTGYSLSYTGTIFNNNKHRLDGSVFGSKQFSGPYTVRGNFDYFRNPNGQTSIGVSRTGYQFSHTGNIFNNNKHRLDGSVFGSKPFGGPLTVGGNLDYSHTRTGSRLSVGATHTRGFGTDVTAEGRLNIFQSRNGRTSADIGGQFNRHYGGPQGTGRPSYSGFLNIRHRF